MKLEKWVWWTTALLGCALLLASASFAQEKPYFVTYSSDLEEPGNLEVSSKTVQASPQYGNPFLSETLEFEYGAKAWWTTELYLSGQHTLNDSTVFGGWRWENRFQPLPTHHFINPILYVEYEDLNLAEKSILEVTGHASQADFLLSNAQARKDIERSLEIKLILSSDFKGWNVSENFISEKAFSSEPWEFGYAVGASRPLGLKASPKPCTFCRQNFAAGVELYGGLGDANGFGLEATSQYLGPSLAFNIPNGPSLSFGANFGLNANSLGEIYRFNISYEFQQIFGRLHRDRSDVKQ
ncbi:MAG TPA: hypothetical protein VGG15_12310 [Terriglobales bacterium]|jgi:hypothetical protein